jgi:NADP-dependent 3-hydroxy acid dehydrogenase YdfG/Flp pilus assembly protein TadD
MSYTKLIIAYCAENQYIVSKIASMIATRLPVEKIAFDDKTSMETLKKEIVNSPNVPVLALITDNFLKSETCMHEALSVVQELGSKKRLIPVVADGTYQKGDNGEYMTVPTSFERVSNVIQYMNYWQDKYLELRRMRPEDEYAHAEKVRIARGISTDIGEMLRYLRSMDYWTYDTLLSRDFAPLFTHLGVSVPVRKEPAEHVAIKYTVQPPAEVKPPVETKKLPIDIPVPEPSVAKVPSEVKKPEPVVIKKAEIAPTEEPELVAVGNVYSESARTASSTTSSAGSSGFDKKELEARFRELIDNDLDAPSILESLLGDTKKSRNGEAIVNLNGGTPRNEKSQEEIKPPVKVNGNGQAPYTNGQLKLPAAPSTSNGERKDAEITRLVEEKKRREDKPEVKETVKPIPRPPFAPVVEAPIEDAVRLIQNGRSEEGFFIFKNMVDKQPKNSDLRYQYASLLSQNMRFAESIKQLEILVKSNPTHADAYVLLAYLAEQHKNYPAARTYLEKVVAINADYQGIYYKLGLINNEHFKGQRKNAANYFKEAFTRDPQNADAHYQFATIKLEVDGDYSTAIQHFEKTLELNAKHPKANYDLAIAFYEQDERLKAFKFYQQACLLNPIYKTEANDEMFKYEIISDSAAEQTSNADKVVLITGATSGIGKATAAVFAKNGFRLILTGRREERLDEIKTAFENDFNSQVQTLNFDVRNLEAVKKSVATLAPEWRNVDILINNAGLAKGLSPIHEGDVEDWNLMIDTNIKGLLYVTRAIAPYMVKRQKGHIINIGATAGKEVAANGNVYAATKHAVEALTKAMRLDLYKHNIRVSQVAPGNVEDTQFAADNANGNTEQANFQSLKSSDVAEAIYFIVTRPEYVNIQDIMLMGTNAKQ